MKGSPSVDDVESLGESLTDNSIQDQEDNLEQPLQINTEGNDFKDLSQQEELNYKQFFSKLLKFMGPGYQKDV